MQIKFCRKLIILASFLFVLGFAQTQVSADDSSSSSSTLVNQDTLNAIDDASKQADKAVDEVTSDAEKKSGDTTTTDTSFKASDAQNINKLNDSLFSWQPYSEKIGVTDLANNTGMGLAKFFWYLNTLIYQINDELLSALSNDGNLSKAFTQAQNAVSSKVKGIFDEGKVLFGGLALIVLAITGFMHFASGRTSSAVRMVVHFLGILLIATLWYGNGNELFNQINQASDAGQAQVLKVIGNSNDNVKPGDTLRVGYFERSIERPYFLMNYGKATADDVTKIGKNPYQFISTNSSRTPSKIQATVDSVAKKSPALQKDNSFNKAGMSLVAIVVSIVNAIPYDAVALFNIFVMVIELSLYLLSPFVLVSALFPQFSRNGYKIVGATIMWGIAKIGSGFLIVLVGALQTFTDSFITVNNFGSYAVNAFLFFFLVYIVYKFRGKLFEFVGVSYSRVEGNMPQSMRLSNLREKGQSIKQSSVGQKISQMGPMQRMSQRRDVRDEMKTKQAEEKRQQNLSRVRDQLLGKEQAKTQKLSDKNKKPLTVDEFKKPMDSKKSDDPKQAKIEKDGVHLPKSNFEAKQPNNNNRVNNPKSKNNGSDSQQEVAKKREAIKRQLYGDQETQPQPKTLDKVPDKPTFEQSKTPKRQEITREQSKTVDRDKIARELLAERDKQKVQKQQLRDEKVSQLKNKFGKDKS